MALNFLNDGYFAGKVGIGTASPSEKLHVVGSNHILTIENTSAVADRYAQMLIQAGTATNYIWTQNQNSTTYGGANSLNIYTQQAGAIAFFTNGNNERMRIASTGNVGNGTSNPLSQLSIGANAITTKKPTVIIADGVAGGSLVIRGLSPILSFDRTGASPENKILMDGVGLEFKTGTLDAEGDVDFKIKLDGKLQAPAYTQGFLQSDANGNIEISGGGTLPGGPYLPLAGGVMTGPIDFNGTAGDHGEFEWTSGNGTTGDVWSLGFYQNSAFRAGIDFFATTEAAGDGNIRFKSGNITTLTLDASQNATFAGNVTVGANTVQNGANPGLKIQSTNTSQTVLGLHNTTTRNWEVAVGGSGNSVGAGLFYIYDNTANDARLVIDTSGNVGIGTTSPAYKLDVNGDARSTHFRDGSKGTGTTSTTAGWYKVASWTGGSKRGGSEIKLSTTGGSFTPITWIIRCYKNWSGDATLKLEQYGYSNIYFTKARVEYDSTASVYYLEIYQPGTTAISFNMYQTSLMGYDSNVTMVTGTLAAGTTGGTTRTELPFIAGGTSVEALTIGNSGNTGPYLPLAGGTMTGTNGVLMPDNFKLKFGDATTPDLEIYHNGTNSFIETSTSSTGDLYIKAQGTGNELVLQATDDILIRPQGGENGIKVHGNDSVELYFNNVRKLRTTSGGVFVEGEIKIDSALLDNQENTNVDTGAEVVAQVSTSTYTAAFFDFVIKKVGNIRSGTVYACHDGTNVEFTETSTQDLGDTSDVTLSVDISGTNLRLIATVTSDDWIIKSLIRAI